MKLLEIKNQLGYFLDNNGKFASIEKITKVDLLRLVESTLTNDVEFDEYSEEDIKNQAHQIVYKSIFEKLQVLSGRKHEFVDESERLYLLEYEKYQGEPSQQDT